MSAVADVLNGAADLIERDGWCQGWYKDGGRRCIARAIDDASECAGRLPDDAAWIARNVVSEVVGANWTIWNDTLGRTEAEVVAALRAAAALAS